MEFFRIKKDIPFMRHALVFNVISLFTFLLAVFFLFNRGLHLSVEFTGGTLIEVSYAQAADLNKIRDSLGKAGYTDTSVQNFGSSRDVLIRLPLKAEQSSAKIGETVMSALDAEVPGDVTLSPIDEARWTEVSSERMSSGMSLASTTPMQELASSTVP